MTNRTVAPGFDPAVVKPRGRAEGLSPERRSGRSRTHRGRDSPGPVVPVSACVSALLSQPPFARSPLPPKLLVDWASLAAAASPNARRGAAGCAVTSCDSHCPLLSRACCAGLLAACWCCLSLSPRAVWCGRPPPPPPPPASPAPSPRPPLPPLLLLPKRRLRPLPSPADPRKPPAACVRVSCCTPPLAVSSAWFSLTTPSFGRRSSLLGGWVGTKKTSHNSQARYIIANPSSVTILQAKCGCPLQEKPAVVCGALFPWKEGTTHPRLLM